MQQRGFGRLSKAGKVVNGHNSRDYTCTKHHQTLTKGIVPLHVERIIQISQWYSTPRFASIPHACIHTCMYARLLYRVILSTDHR
jgi:hypothetical protein